jgi:hypothetical protein
VEEEALIDILGRELHDLQRKIEVIQRLLEDARE